MKKIIIISNDRLFIKKNIYSSNYNDTINIFNGFKNFKCYLISRRINNFQKFETNLKNFKIYKSLEFKNKSKINLFIISLTLFNFINYLFLYLKFGSRLSGYIYLRSDGFKEYKINYGFLGYFFYWAMFKIVTSKLEILSVNKNLTHVKKCKTICPSELDKKWFLGIKKAKLDKPRLLYIGRMKKEKGIFWLIEILKKLNLCYIFNIVGLDKNKTSYFKKINFFTNESNLTKVIKFYDEANIFILPSFTEGSPKVILESLARRRPVIIFDNIRHVKKNFKGVFVIKRNTISLKNKIELIIKNYKKIQKKMTKNNLQTKRNFHLQLKKLFND